MTDHPMHATFRLCLLLGLISASSVALSADPVVASVRGGASITADELMSEVLRLPAPAQAQALARPADLAQAAQNLAIRRELARQAEADSLPNDPAVAAALRSARERVLAEAALARLEGKAPDKAALERLARSQYDASPEKFETPEQVRVRHILVSAKACEAEARARDLLAQARQPGADFAALAKANSDDPGSAARGGDLGFSARGKMAPAFEAAAFALKQPGDLSDVVKTEFGYHVIRLEERKPASRQPFEAVREGLVKSLAEGEARNRRQEAVERIAAGVQVDQGVIEGLVASRSKPGS
jgi:peptidyl-prolyl cis-trans isomerase C